MPSAPPVEPPTPVLPLEIKISTYRSDNLDDNREPFPPIKQNRSGYWVLNPGAPFELTVMNTDKKIVQFIRDLLDGVEIGDYKRRDVLVALFSEYNIKIKEIEDYKYKYQARYLSKIEELKRNSYEWDALGEKYKDDLMVEFRNEALNVIYERAECDFEILFEREPKYSPINDKLISEFGFDVIQTYITYSGDFDKIRNIPNDAHNRQRFERLVEFGLAIRGSELSKEEVLSKLTLKELNAIASNPAIEYKRKAPAIEYILTLSNIEQIIGKHISLRSLFKLIPLRQKYSSVNLHDISTKWKYHAEEVKLLMATYRYSFYSWGDLKRYAEYIEDIDGYSISRPFREGYDICPCGKDRSQHKYSKKYPPQVPFHIGCTCSLRSH